MSSVVCKTSLLFLLVLQQFLSRDNEPSEEVKNGSDCDTSQEANVEEDDNLVGNPGEDNMASGGEVEGGDEVSTGVESRRSSVGDPRRPKILTFHEKRLQGLMGPDAVQYLRFQKYIIIFILFTTTVSLGVILPLNFQVKSHFLLISLKLMCWSGDTARKCYRLWSHNIGQSES